MIDPGVYLCDGEDDEGLSNDAMCLMFSCVVNRPRGNMSGATVLIKFGLISNVELEPCVEC